jgi:hypothetical protein
MGALEVDDGRTFVMPVWHLHIVGGRCDRIGILPRLKASNFRVWGGEVHVGTLGSDFIWCHVLFVSSKGYVLYSIRCF